ncbi:hypothetical protein KY320_01175, partial [Candidatus Woesearchaeota archaeon]|nr:hypothetical protein [Candidatus Woesearchaeota archaeon]
MSEQSGQLYSEQDLNMTKQHAKREHKWFLPELILVLAMLLGLMLWLKPQLTGMVVGEQNATVQEIGVLFEESTDFAVVAAGNISSLRVSGSVIGAGSAGIYLGELLVFSYKGVEEEAALAPITGMVTGGEEPQANETVNETEVNATDANQTAPNATAQPVAIFENECVETCALPNFGSELVLTIVVENASLNLSSTTYTLFEAEETAVEENLSVENVTSIKTEVNVSEVNVTEEVVEDVTVEEVEEVPENITVETKVNITEEAPVVNVTEEPEVNVTQVNMTEEAEVNVSEVNITEEIEVNITANVTAFNISFANISYENISHTHVVVGRAVSWSEEISAEVAYADLPKEAYNVEVDKHADKVKLKVEDEEFGVDEYNANKQEFVALNEFDKIKQKDGKEKVLKENIKLDLTEVVESVTLGYSTPGPQKVEQIINQHKKIVTISSEIHYTDVFAYTEIDNVEEERIQLFWLKEDGKEVIDADYLDMDGNGLIDRIEWIVPHLSNESYEISITVLNPITFLRDGETWTVKLNTTGMADLTITSPNAGWTEMLTDNAATFDEME